MGPLEEPCCAEQWLVTQPVRWSCYEVLGEPGFSDPSVKIWCCKISGEGGRITIIEIGKTRSQAASHAVARYWKLLDDLRSL